MKILITGAKGQLGQALVRSKPTDVLLYALSRHELDLGDSNKIHECINTIQPDWIINAAAMTQVDEAEKKKEACFAINAEAVHQIALAAKKTGAKVLQISTDYVFDGKQGRPYLPDATVSPIKIYGESKALAEKWMTTLLPNQGWILRPTWIYSASGGVFVKTVLRLLQEKDCLHIVEDQIATPTSVEELVNFIWKMIQLGPLPGVYHFTDAGVASRYDFAVAIAEEAFSLGMLSSQKPIFPVSSDYFPMLAKRPAFSVLDKHSSWAACDYTPLHWREALRMTLRRRLG